MVSQRELVRKYADILDRLPINERAAALKVMAEVEEQHAQLQRQSMAAESWYGVEDEPEEPFLDPALHPKNWKMLARRDVPWPKDLDPRDAVRQMAPFLVYRLKSDAAAQMGRRVQDLGIGLDDQI